MDNAEQYRDYNDMALRDADMIIKEFSPKFTWFENESFLDVGCGPGNVTAEILRPLLPSPSGSIVGVDISPNMVEFANKYHSSDNVHFERLDFGTKNITDLFKEGQFTKVFSFYAMQWIKDLEQAAINIRTLLQPGGDFLISMLTSFKLHEVYRELSKMDEWKEYMTDVERVVPRFHESADPSEDIQKIFTSEGLQVIKNETRKGTYIFPNMKICTGLYESVNPFVSRMDKETREKHTACYMQLMIKHGVFTENASGQVVHRYPMVLLYGKRPASPQ